MVRRYPNGFRENAQAFREAVLYNALNPLAQVSRFTDRKSGSKRLRSEEDLDIWRKKVAPNLDPVEPDKKRVRRNPLPNLRTTAHFENMAEGHGSDNNMGLTETPIDNVDWANIHRGPPNYTFASLPFYYDRFCSQTRWNDQWTFRMTSPYDCSVTSSTTDVNIGAGTDTVMSMSTDAADAAQQKARWFDLYSGIYKYYHVVAAKWWIIFENMSTEPLWVHQYYSNETDLPATGTNADMFYWQGVQSHYVGPVANAIQSNGIVERQDMNVNTDNKESAATAGTTANYETGNMVVSRGAPNVIQLSGEYKTGDFKNEIHNDALVENWTLCTTNPALSERLSIRIRPQWDSQAPVAGDASSRDRQISYRYRIGIDYLVEFKELKAGIKYPLQNQPLTVTIAQSIGTE